MRMICAAAALLVGAISLPALAQDLPDEIAGEIGQKREYCVEPGGRFELRGNAVTRVDVNGDGALDYFVDHSGMICAGIGNGEGCAQFGCSLSIYLSGRRVALALAFGDETLGWRTVAGPGGAVRIEIDEAQCERPRDGCTRTYEASGTDLRQVAVRPLTGVPLARPTNGARWRVASVRGTRVAAVAGPPGAAAVAVLCRQGSPVIHIDLGARRSTRGWVYVTLYDGESGTSSPFRPDPASGHWSAPFGPGEAAPLVGPHPSAAISVADAFVGTLSLDGARAALREALAPCSAGIRHILYPS